MDNEIENTLKGLTQTKEEEWKLQLEIEEVLADIPQEIINECTVREQKTTLTKTCVEESWNLIRDMTEVYNDKSNDVSEKWNRIKNIFASTWIAQETKTEIFSDVVLARAAKTIEDCWIQINFPIFNGWMLISVIENIRTEKQYEIKVLKQYLMILRSMGVLPGTPNRTHDPSSSDARSEVISDFIFFKIVSSIFLNINKPKKEISFLLELTDTLVSYLAKAISNLNELFITLFRDEQEWDPMQVPINTIVHTILSILFKKLSNFLISNNEHWLASVAPQDFLSLIQKINDFNSDLFAHYKYNAFNNSSLNIWLEQVPAVTGITLDSIIETQIAFNDYTISLRIKELIDTETKSGKYNGDDINDLTKLLWKDNLFLFLTFKDTKLIPKIIIYSCNQILGLFRSQYNDQVKLFNFSQQAISQEQSWFIFNLLYNYLSIFNNFFADLEEITGIGANEQYSSLFTNHWKELNGWIEIYLKIIIKSHSYDSIINWFTFESLTKGNTKEKIYDIFKDSIKDVEALCSCFDKANVCAMLCNFIEWGVFDAFSNKLMNTLEKSLKRPDLKVKEIDIVVDKIKGFISQLSVLSGKEEWYSGNDNEDKMRKIKGIYSLLNNLEMKRV